jgi:hypothetical protein
MALSFEQEPISDSTTSPVITNWTPIVPYVLYRNVSIASLFYYKLVLEIRLTDSSGTLLGKIKVNWKILTLIKMQQLKQYTK